MSQQKPIVVVGSINLDLVAVAERIPSIGETLTGTSFQIHPGGKGANQAVAVARLGYPVHMIGRLGNDGFALQLREHLQGAGVNIAGVGTSEGASGVAVIEVSATGENSIIIAPGANAKVTPEDIAAHMPILREAGMVLTQLETPLETVEFLCTVCAREGIPIILDPAPAQELPASLFKHITWLTPNETEAAFYAGTQSAESSEEPAAIARALQARGCRGVVLKMGAQGVFLASQQVPGQALPAFAVKAVDTTAAGDAFNGAFAVGLMLGKTQLESATFAAAVAAISVTRAGAQPSMPTLAEADAFLRAHEPVR